MILATPSWTPFTCDSPPTGIQFCQFRMDHGIGKSTGSEIRILAPLAMTELNSNLSSNSTKKYKKGEQVRADLPLEDETETARPHRPPALLPRRTGALGTAARGWRRKPAGGTIFPKSKLEVDAIGTRARAAAASIFLRPLRLA